MLPTLRISLSFPVLLSAEKGADDAAVFPHADLGTHKVPCKFNWELLTCY